MNQGQNNLNPNNFNVQGDNGISNNLSCNPQPQQTPIFQQPIMQESTPQSNNTLESSNINDKNINITSKKKMNLGLIIGFIIIVGIIIIGITFGTKLLNKNDVNLKPNNDGSDITDKNDNSDNNIGNTNEDNNDLIHKEHNRFFSTNDIITSKNNYFEYNNYKWEFLFDDINSVSIWQGTIKNISNKNLKGNLRLKFYDLNYKVIGDVQKYDLDYEVDSSNVFVLEPGEESNISFTYYSEELNEGYNLQDVKYISIEDIE